MYDHPAARARTPSTATLALSHAPLWRAPRPHSLQNVWVNRSFHSAGKVRMTLGGGGAAGSIHRGASVADPAAKMTIGRQMSMLADGTMVIHSSAPRGVAAGARGQLPSSMRDAAAHARRGEH